MTGTQVLSMMWASESNMLVGLHDASYSIWYCPGEACMDPTVIALTKSTFDITYEKPLFLTRKIAIIHNGFCVDFSFFLKRFGQEYSFGEFRRFHCDVQKFRCIDFDRHTFVV